MEGVWNLTIISKWAFAVNWNLTETIEQIGVLVKVAAHITIEGTNETVSAKRSSIGTERSSNRWESDPTKPNASDLGGWAQSYFDREGGSLKVGRTDLDLYDVRLSLISIKEHSNYWIVTRSKSLLDICSNNCWICTNCQVIVTEVTQLYMTIAWGPEVESNDWPDGSSVGEIKNYRWCIDLWGWYIKGVGSEGTHWKVLQGWIDKCVPRATLGTFEKGVSKVYSNFWMLLAAPDLTENCNDPEWFQKYLQGDWIWNSWEGIVKAPG